MELTNEDVRDILQVLDGLPYGELQLETARFRLSLRRGADGGWTQTTEVLAAEAAPRDAAAAPAATGHPAVDASEPAVAAEEDLVDVRAPLLGTFYRAPRPGAPPFVTVGSHVEPETVVCIIETMKLMNSVTAGAAGTIAVILTDNAQFAEQGAVLMRIRAPR
ncbi:MAG: biotin/lipoyl-containing protein [Streptosporangiaceae bacterium]